VVGCFPHGGRKTKIHIGTVQLKTTVVAAAALGLPALHHWMLCGGWETNAREVLATDLQLHSI